MLNFFWHYGLNSQSIYNDKQHSINVLQAYYTEFSTPVQQLPY